MLKFLDHLEEWLIQVNMSWAQELCIYMFVWMAKFGAAYGVRTGVHVGVDVMINQLSVRTRAKFIFFSLGAGALFTGVVAAFGANFVWQLAHTDQTSPDMELPMWLVYLLITLRSRFIGFRFLLAASALRR